MPFYVHAQDKPGVEADMVELAEAHWSYMDKFADRLILRGPTLSDDGADHTGSVHVVDLADRASAELFATEEPYWLAGLYRQVTTVRTDVLLQREATERSLTPEEPNSLITGAWPARPRDARAGEGQQLGDSLDSRLSFVTVLVDDDQSHTTGIVGVVRTIPNEAPGIIQSLADQLAGGSVALTAQRWSRGGRS